MATDDKPLVLILGATGRTGKSLVNGLLASGNFRVAATTREVSLPTEPVQKLRARGVEIRVADLDKDTPAKLQALLAGVDIILSAVNLAAFQDQKRLFDAAAAVGTVKRVVPCDWQTPGARGVRWFHDWKLDVHAHIKALGLPYTFIDVGWWPQLLFPFAPGSAAAAAPDYFRRDELVGTGAEYRLLLTDVRSIGAWTARILADPRTLNASVIVWEWELTHLRGREIAEAVYAEGGGDAEALRNGARYLTPEWVAEEARETGAGTLTGKEDGELVMRSALAGSRLSMFVLEENTLENAKRLGYLDARELYPDIEVPAIEGFVKAHLENPDGVYAEL